MNRQIIYNPIERFHVVYRRDRRTGPRVHSHCVLFIQNANAEIVFEIVVDY